MTSESRNIRGMMPHGKRDDVAKDEMADDKLRLQLSLEIVTDSESPSSSVQLDRQTKIIPWWSYIWDYDPSRSKEERKFLQKLDFSLLTILSLGYFIKNLDQTNISNAYVSGMKEALKMNANELNMIDIAWTTGYVIGQLPSQFILTKVRPSIWIPSCELVWTVLTFSLAFATSSKQVIAIRFFVGLVESIFYPAAHFLIGSWYKPSELGKRACIFHASSAAAGMFSGYLQAAVYKGMNGTLGREGWQWLFIMDGIISLPICLAGFFLIPDLPENTRAFYLTEDDAEMARKRMHVVGRAPRKDSGWSLSIVRRTFSRWHVYALTLLYVVFINTGPSGSVAPMALWLKSKGFPVSLINIIPTGQSAVQLVTTIGFAIFSDYLRNRPLVMGISASFGFLAYLFLAIWNIPTALHYIAYFIGRAAVAFGPLAMSWANEICGSDAEERAIVLGVMNAGGYAVNAWLPLLTYPVRDAPRFRKGFTYSVVAMVGQVGVMGGVWALKRWEDRRRRRRGDEGEEVLIYDLANIKSDPVSMTRLERTIDELYISEPYFTSSEAESLKNTSVPFQDEPESIKDEAGDGLGEFHEIAELSEMEKFSARGARQVVIFGLADRMIWVPVYLEVFGFEKGELEDEKFLGRLRRSGVSTSEEEGMGDVGGGIEGTKQKKGKKWK
ncbi:hypothetical protein VTL71DRAFT_14977 [Oculimacula yallundae]|uniref:Major facilitator superfamily (MFS) profile domain-containing protein n=1 Tax=Oculimacula yallundae TaxID=86028 RepID=A0ABR4CFA7_9HELO